MDDALAHRVTSEARSLRRLTHNLTVFQKTHTGHRRYPKELQPVFDFFQGALLAVKEYGIVCKGDIVKKSDIYGKNLLKAFHTIKQIIKFLYEKLYAAVLSDTLNTPYPMLQYLNTLTPILPIPNPENVKIAFLAARPMMYYHYPMEEVESLITQLKGVVPRIPEYPEGLALVGYPYTEATNSLLNCALVHELGHYAYRKSTVAKIVQNEINKLDLTKTTFDNLFESDYWLLNCKRSLRKWSSEIFADTFAVLLCGPAYCFALREFLNLLPVNEYTQSSFSSSHPAVAYRWHMHARLLKQTGWLDIMKDESSLEERWISTYIPVRKYSVDFLKKGSLTEPVLQCFDTCAKIILSDCESRFSEIAETSVQEYLEIGKTVRRYFEHGVPPAQIIEGDSIRTPSPSTVLNAAWFLSLQELEPLLDAMDKKGDMEMLERMELRLSGWVSKALSDIIYNSGGTHS